MLLIYLYTTHIRVCQDPCAIFSCSRLSHEALHNMLKRLKSKRTALWAWIRKKYKFARRSRFLRHYALWYLRHGQMCCRNVLFHWVQWWGSPPGFSWGNHIFVDLRRKKSYNVWNGFSTHLTRFDSPPHSFSRTSTILTHNEVFAVSYMNCLLRYFML